MNYYRNVSQTTRDSLMRELADLRNVIDGIEDFQSGRNVSPETAFVHNLTEMFWIDFRDERARDAYLANEIHKSIGAKLMASLEGGAEGIFVCDVRL
jgi:hypothetical protein